MVVQKLVTKSDFLVRYPCVFKDIVTKVLVKRDKRRHKLQSAFILSSKIKVRNFPDLYIVAYFTKALISASILAILACESSLLSPTTAM